MLKKLRSYYVLAKDVCVCEREREVKKSLKVEDGNENGQSAQTKARIYIYISYMTILIT